ncbi:Nascent polypeptide-associated complex subunit beta [Serendipita sp. 396]|nr:Nascent polypeptide-associated complex subunit beta [Serendipita sp. 396]
MPVDAAKLAKLQSQAAASRIGGKGTPRRKVVNKAKAGVHGAPAANTFAVYGTGHVKELTELVPGILNQLGPDSLASLRKLAESYQALQQGQQRAAAASKETEDDEDVPDLVESFEVPDTAAETKTAGAETKNENLEGLD